MVGGIFLGGYVDRTKEYKSTTLACFGVALAALAALGIAEGDAATLPQGVVLALLMALGLSVGPVQPINAELAVEVGPIRRFNMEANKEASPQ